jgi:hypothetical protein
MQGPQAPGGVAIERATRWVHACGVVAHLVCAGVWSIARNAGVPATLAFPGNEAVVLLAQNVVIFYVAWSACTCALRCTWRSEAVDALDALVAWSALSAALGAILGFGSLELLLCFAGLEGYAALASSLWMPPARRRPALVRYALVAGGAHALASAVALSHATLAQPSAVGAVLVHIVALTAAGAACYAFDANTPEGGGVGNGGTLGRFEADARAAAQLAARVATFFALQSAAVRTSPQGTPVPYAVPPETLEAVAPLACVALFGVWLLFAYPEKVEKPAYRDGNIGSLRAGRGDDDRPSTNYALRSWGDTTSTGGGGTVSVSIPPPSGGGFGGGGFGGGPRAVALSGTPNPLHVMPPGGRSLTSPSAQGGGGGRFTSQTQQAVEGPRPPQRQVSGLRPLMNPAFVQAY